MSTELDAYFERIEYRGKLAPELGVLQALHLSHPLAIPFENLSTLIGEPVRLDLESLQDKLVTSRRGGYCFEQNRLFAAALEACGFEVTALAARVVWNSDTHRINPRTHMVLLVKLPGSEEYVADVGFGGITLTAPLRFEPGLSQRLGDETFRLVESGSEYELQVNFESAWRGMYRFDLQPQLPVDFEVSNHFVATHPDSPFRTMLMAARPILGGRYALANRELSLYAGGKRVERRNLSSTAEIKSVLREIFGIQIPESPALDAQLARISAEPSKG